MPTSEDGSCEFETVKPGRVPGPGSVHQAPHFEIAVFARGMLKQLFTRIYFAGVAANQEDPVLALVSRERRETLMAHPDPARPSHWNFDIRLQGEQETVFFDV
jgi:protocatechuate 3,4-dioxygenase alpha subunit